jgi:hypothetical protein
MCKAGIPQGGLCEDRDDLRLIDQADVLVSPGVEKRKAIIVKMRLAAILAGWRLRYPIEWPLKKVV